MKHTDRPGKRDIRSLILFPLLIVVVTVLPIIFWQELITLFSSGRVLQEFLDGLGIRGILIFIGIQVTQVVFFIIPGNVIQVSAGYLFGLLPGVIYSMIGILIGTMVNYLIGYRLGSSFVRQLIKEQTFDNASAMANSFRGLLGVSIFFLIPATPKDAFVFVAGALRINPRLFIIVSSAARLPALVGSVAIGASISNEQWVLAIVISAVALLGFLLGVVFRKPIQRRFSKKK